MVGKGPALQSECSSAKAEKAELSNQEVAEAVESHHHGGEQYF